MPDTQTAARLCPCGASFDPPKRQPLGRQAASRYCSGACRTRFSPYGRSYGTVVPRQLGWTKT